MKNSSIYDYFRQFEKYDFIPSGEVSALVQKAKAGDRKAINNLVCSHQRFIFSVAKKYGFWKKGMDIDFASDIMSAGNIGFMDSIRRFDESKGAPFLKCAEFGIRNALGESFRKSSDSRQVLTEPEKFDLCEKEGQKSVETEAEENELKENIKKSMYLLSPKERFIIMNHFGLNCDKLSLTKIGEKLSITKQRCQQIEKQAFQKIREENIFFMELAA